MTENFYTVIRKNGEASIETDNNVRYGSMPSYNGQTPTKPETQQYKYTFAGWDKDVTAVTGDVTYTAKFNAEVKAPAVEEPQITVDEDNIKKKYTGEAKTTAENFIEQVKADKQTIVSDTELKEALNILKPKIA